MEEVKVAKIQILPTTEQQQQLTTTMVEYTRVCNVISLWIFNNNFKISHHTVQKHIYHSLRACSCLSSRMVQDAIRTVCARYKAVQVQLAKKPVQYKDDTGIHDYKLNGKKVYQTLDWLWKPIEFKKPQYDLLHGTSYSFINSGKQMSIATTTGRVRMNYRYQPYFSQYLDGTWKLGTAKLIRKNNKWFLHVPCSREIPEYERTVLSTVVGIDRGERFLATVYDGKNTWFWSGKDVMHRRDRYVKTRKNLQAHNTRNSRRRLRKIGHRENSWMSNLNHTATKALCETYGPNTVFVLEDLEGVSSDERNFRCSKRNRRQKRSWAFYQFEQFLTYKAAAMQSKVLIVNPRYTSQRCPKCHVISKEQRDHKHHEYRCSCGFRTNDDRTAAMNIQELGVRWVNGEDKPKYTKTRNLAIAE